LHAKDCVDEINLARVRLIVNIRANAIEKKRE